jgi:hypothetical protein
VVNMHCHTFFSYNAYGHSPSSLAWLAKKNGYAWPSGIVDFDVLDAVDEFLDACDVAGRARERGHRDARLHPRVRDARDQLTGRAGRVLPHGHRLHVSKVPYEARPALASMRERAERRNRAMLERVNAHLAPVAVDYEADVLPLTPAGNATERHMLAAYHRCRAERFPGPTPKARGAFWADKLSTQRPTQVAAAIGDYAKFSNLVRGKLMKQGGVGLRQPRARTPSRRSRSSTA